MTRSASSKRAAPEKSKDDPADMDANVPVLAEKPVPTNQTESLVISALERLGDRLDKLEAKSKTESVGSWQDAAVPSEK